MCSFRTSILRKNVKTKSLGDCAAHKVFQCINDILSSDVPNSLSALTVRKPVDYCNACVLTSSNLVGPESKASQEKSLFKYMSFSSRITCKCNQKLISTTGCFFKSYKKNTQRHYVYCWFVLESANQCYICVNVVQRAFVYIVNAPVYPWSDTCSWPLTPTSSTPVAARGWYEAAALTSLKRRPAAIAHCLFCRATSANSRWPDWLTHRPIVSSIHTASAKWNTQRTRHTCAKGVPQERRWSGVQRQIFGIPMPIECMHTVRAICKSLSSRDELSFSRDQ